MPLIVPAHAARPRAHAGRPHGVVRLGGVVILHCRTYWDLTHRVPRVDGLMFRVAPRA